MSIIILCARAHRFGHQLWTLARPWRWKDACCGVDYMFMKPWGPLKWPRQDVHYIGCTCPKVFYCKPGSEWLIKAVHRRPAQTGAPPPVTEEDENV